MVMNEYSAVVPRLCKRGGGAGGVGKGSDGWLRGRECPRDALRRGKAVAAGEANRKSGVARPGWRVRSRGEKRTALADLARAGTPA